MGPYSLVADVVMLPARRADPLAKLVIEAFISDIPFSSAIHTCSRKSGSTMSLRRWFLPFACVPQ